MVSSPKRSLLKRTCSCSKNSGTSDAQTLQALQYSWDLHKPEDAAWSAARIDGRKQTFAHDSVE